jgi:signal transduction histidine kinase
MAPLVMVEACVAMASHRLDPAAYDDVLEALGALGRGAARTRLVVETLLQEARAGHGLLRRERVELEPLVRDCVATLGTEIGERSAVVTVDPLPAARADPALLSAVLTNLLANALKFNPRSGGQVRVGGGRDEEGATVFVESEGPPIAESDRGRIFEPFHRGHRERRIKGAGLGLAICRRIVERHGGEIGVTSVRGRNRFTFTLPG